MTIVHVPQQPYEFDRWPSQMNAEMRRYVVPNPGSSGDRVHHGSFAPLADGRVLAAWSFYNGSTGNFELRLGYAASADAVQSITDAVTYDRTLLTCGGISANQHKWIGVQVFRDPDGVLGMIIAGRYHTRNGDQTQVFYVDPSIDHYTTGVTSGFWTAVDWFRSYDEGDTWQHYTNIINNFGQSSFGNVLPVEAMAPGPIVLNTVSGRWTTCAPWFHREVETSSGTEIRTPFYQRTVFEALDPARTVWSYPDDSNFIVQANNQRPGAAHLSAFSSAHNEELVFVRRDGGTTGVVLWLTSNLGRYEGVTAFNTDDEPFMGPGFTARYAGSTPRPSVFREWRNAPANRTYSWMVAPDVAAPSNASYVPMLGVPQPPFHGLGGISAAGPSVSVLPDRLLFTMQEWVVGVPYAQGLWTIGQVGWSGAS